MNRPTQKTITLVTDFGTSDPFVGIMKGAMLTIYDQIRFVDISHHVPPQNILQAAYIIQQSFSYFPSGTIHTIVVDPGVGTERRAIIVETEHYCFVAPDNGILSPIYRLSTLKRVVHITEKKFFLKKKISSTFHGRDIFSPVSAWIAKGEKLKNFGNEITDYVTIDMPQPKKTAEGTIKGEIISIDRFGNIITNIQITDRNKSVTITTSGNTIHGLQRTYADSKGEAAALINSWGMVEIFVPQKNASQELNSEIGSTVEVFFK